MNDLAIFTPGTPEAIDSREVAEMVGKQHKNLLADIRGYIADMEKGNALNFEEVNDELTFQPVNFFIPSAYIDSKGETRPNFLVTKKGCEFVANKLTGAKGTQFTALYVTRFNVMERQQQAQLPSSYIEALKALVASEEEKARVEAERKTLAIELDQDHEWYSIKRVAAINHVSFKLFDWRRLKEASYALGCGIRKIFDANYIQVNTYHVKAWEAVYPQYEL